MVPELVDTLFPSRQSCDTSFRRLRIKKKEGSKLGDKKEDQNYVTRLYIYYAVNRFWSDQNTFMILYFITSRIWCPRVFSILLFILYNNLEKKTFILV